MVFIICDIVSPGLHVVGCNSIIVWDISCDIAYDVCYIVCSGDPYCCILQSRSSSFLHCSGFIAVHSTLRACAALSTAAATAGAAAAAGAAVPPPLAGKGRKQRRNPHYPRSNRVSETQVSGMAGLELCAYSKILVSLVTLNPKP
jgi:hypothetical protein